MADTAGISVLACGAVALSLLAAGCSTAGEASEGPNPAAEVAIPVETVRPVRRDMVATYFGTATLEAEADAEVVAKVEGEVIEIRVEEGDRVRAGQILAVLDGHRLHLEAIQADAELAKLERDYRRQLELNERGLVAASAFESLRYDVEALRARRDLANLQLSYTEIRAPFAGVVAARHIKIGRTVQLGEALFRITAPAPLKAQIFVPERELQRLRPGQAATVQVDAVPGERFPARVILVSPTVDERTATFKVTVQVEDPQGRLRPGMFARVGIVFDRRPAALQIPRSALIETDGEPSVFVVEDGIARQRKVRIGLAEAGDVEITAGLTGTEHVVVVGQSALQDGHRVRVVTLQQAAAGPVVSAPH